MKQLSLWLLKNTLLPVAMVMVSAVGATIFQAQEVDAQGYRTLRNAFKEGNPAFKYAVATAISSGKISRWDYTGLLQQYWKENTGLAIPMGATTVAEERVVLAALARQARPPR